MKKLFIITLLFLVQSVPSFGNPNGKGLVCKCIVCPPKYTNESSTYYLFEYNKVKEFRIFSFNEKSSIEEIDYERFYLSKDKIQWLSFSYWNKEFNLNRKNLSLKIELSKNDRKISEVIRECEVLNKNDFQIKLNKSLSDLQKLIDKNLDKDNKI